MAKFAMQSGKLVDISAFKGEDVSIEDIAHHLSKIQRFNGGFPIGSSYSVAEHSINLVQYAANRGGISTLGLRMLLLHDASEAYLSDVVSPAKAHLRDYTRLENEIQAVINRKVLNIVTTIDESIYLKSLDKRILMDEVESIMPEHFDLYSLETGLTKLGCHIHFNNHPSTVKQCFLNLARTLGIARS